MICDFGDVVVVPFPFVDVAVVKRRPALVLSVAAFNDDNQQSIMAMLTTAAGSSWPTDIAIDDLASAGLKRPSVLRWKLFTLPNDMIAGKAGKLAAPDRAKISAVLTNILAVPQ